VFLFGCFFSGSVVCRFRVSGRHEAPPRYGGILSELKLVALIEQFRDF
jgi:hypothetical protein